jgi:hypothetical protein
MPDVPEPTDRLLPHSEVIDVVRFGWVWVVTRDGAPTNLWSLCEAHAHDLADELWLMATYDAEKLDEAVHGHLLLRCRDPE